MENQKTQKLVAEIEKTKAKISELQTKLRNMERQKTVLENEQIIALVRSERISDSELAKLMHSLRKPNADTVAVHNDTDMEESIDYDEDDYT
ncbi:MAG: DUF4315 family protein [Oscillospiraceae bacterium]|nr:DUF4315 family protein [Oscillospiraceae bacterium]MCL2279750.1 DUF4315 family protein [Oscillospiraceae bacterium]